MTSTISFDFSTPDVSKMYVWGIFYPPSPFCADVKYGSPIMAKFDGRMKGRAAHLSRADTINAAAMPKEITVASISSFFRLKWLFIPNPAARNRCHFITHLRGAVGSGI